MKIVTQVVNWLRTNCRCHVFFNNPSNILKKSIAKGKKMLKSEKESSEVSKQKPQSDYRFRFCGK